METAIALHAVAAVLLVLAGLAKMARPEPAADLAGVLGLPARPGLARLIGCVEVAAGLAALAAGGPVAAGAVGLFYAAFALVVLRARMVGAPSCGCFGKAAAPPSRIHFAGNLTLAGASLAAAAAGERPVDAVVGLAGAQPAVAVALVLAVGVLAGLVIVAFTALPEALHARSGAGRRADVFRIEPGSLRRHASRPEGAGSRA